MLMKESQKLIFPSTNVDIQRQKNLELEIEKKLDGLRWVEPERVKNPELQKIHKLELSLKT